MLKATQKKIVNQHQQTAHDWVALKNPLGKKLPSGFTRDRVCPHEPGVKRGAFIESGPSEPAVVFRTIAGPADKVLPPFTASS